ncbi:MAG: DUF350 domain-containing protein [Flavobacteriales bacterium]|nr:DUF350 domain-containing protein [Flavobacteriales bacterium]
MDSLLNNEYFGFIVPAAVYITAGIILFLIGRIAFRFFHPKIKVIHEVVEVDNVAFSISYVGYYIGILIVIGSSIIGPSKGLKLDFVEILAYGLLGIVLLNISAYINDKIVFRKFSVKKEIIEDKNLGTGVIELSNFIGSGLIIFGAIIGDQGSMESGLVSAIMFWAFGQLAFLLVSFIYNKVTPFDIHHEIERDNFAAGIGYAGAIIAIANLFRLALSIDYDGFVVTVIEVTIIILVGIILIPISRVVVDKILFPGYNLTDEIVHQEKPNTGAALVEAFAYIGSSVLISWCL